MKKLLALVLCIAMIASISVTAFAAAPPTSGLVITNEIRPISGTPLPPSGTGITYGFGPISGKESTTSTVKKPNLWPVVQQQHRLYNSFSYLFNDKVVAGLVNMFVTKYPDLIKNNEDANKAVKALARQYKTADQVDDKVFLLPSNLNRLVTFAFDDVRQAFVGEIHAYKDDISQMMKDNTKYTDGTITGAIANVEIGVINSFPSLPAIPDGPEDK